MLDLIKNPFDFIDLISLDRYNYKYEGILSFENNKTYQISFTPSDLNVSNDFEGNIFIDTKTYAIVKIEFAYTKKSIKSIKQSLVIKKVKGIKVFPKRINYDISYKEYQGKYYINHVICQMLYKAKLKRKFIASKYQIHFEMITTDITTSNLVKIRRHDKMNTHQILTDLKKSKLNKNDTFWEFHNNILPEQDLIKALSNFKVEELKIENNP
jgi:hypothetical protein